MRQLAQVLLSIARMYGISPITLCTPLVGACAIPFPSDVEGDFDAGINTTPVIQSATPKDLAFPGPLALKRGDARTVTLHARDTDIDDTLYVRMFRDYSPANTAFLVDVEIPITNTVDRVHDISLSTWCSFLGPGDDTLHHMEALIADRAFLDCQAVPKKCLDQPAQRELPTGAQWSTASWFIKCNAPQ